MVESAVPFDLLDELGDQEPVLTEALLATLAELADQQEAIRDAALSALLVSYPAQRERFLPHLADPAVMPEVRCVADFAPLVELRSINLHWVEKKGYAYFGLILGCTWDEEHSVGLMMHRTRVVELGGADTAVLDWIAERDAKQMIKQPAGKKATAKQKAKKATVKKPAGKKATVKQKAKKASAPGKL